MIDVVKSLNWRFLRVFPRDLTEAKTDLLFRHLGDQINSLQILNLSLVFFKAEWTLKWFQAGVFQRLHYLIFNPKDILEIEDFETFDEAWRTKLPSDVRFCLCFKNPEDKLERISPWLRHRVDEFILVEVSFEYYANLLATFSNMRTLELFPVGILDAHPPAKTAAAFAAIAKGCKRLQTLKLSMGRCHSLVVWKYFKAFLASIPDFRALKKLRFASCLEGELAGANNNEKENVFAGLANSALKELFIMYKAESVSNPWRDIGKYLPKTLEKFTFVGRGNVVQNLSSYNSEGNLKDVHLTTGGGMNELAFLDFIKSAPKLKDLKHDGIGWMMSDGFRDALDAVRSRDTKMDILAKNTRIVIGYSPEKPFYPWMTS